MKLVCKRFNISKTNAEYLASLDNTDTVVNMLIDCYRLNPKAISNLSMINSTASIQQKDLTKVNANLNSLLKDFIVKEFLEDESESNDERTWQTC